jgi:hypothetical protein
LGYLKTEKKNIFCEFYAKGTIIVKWITLFN